MTDSATQTTNRLRLTDETADDYASIKRSGQLAYYADQPGPASANLSMHGRRAWAEGWTEAMRKDWGLAAP